MTSNVIELIVGLGNPGSRYAQTRHNAGFFLVDELARSCQVNLRNESKFHGDVAKANLAGQAVWLLKPDCFMNLSGQSIQAIANFYKIQPSNILVVHDELDLSPGVARLKRGGGHGGHNGLRDTIEKLASKDFARLRIGIGHPGDKSRVHDYVLHAATRDEQIAIDQAINDSLAIMNQVVAGDWDKAMNTLHSH